jgi:hypothetical protein
VITLSFIDCHWFGDVSLFLWSGSFSKSVTIGFKHSVQGLTASVGNQVEEFRSTAGKNIGETHDKAEKDGTGTTATSAVADSSRHG